MSELLLELFSEEIPARMQVKAADDLRRLMTEGLKARGLETGDAKSFSTPRRLTLVIGGVPAQSPAISEEKKGPRVGAPEQAVAGFLKSAGLASLKDAEIIKDEKKGDYYVAKIEKPGRAAPEIIAETVAEVMAKFPWPKSMRWGSEPFQWVRPLQSILCILGGKVVPFEVAGIHSGAETSGHRFLGPDIFMVKNFADYEAKLEKHHVMLDPARRSASIGGQALALAKTAKLEWVEDDARMADRADWHV
jgi:glycyl-tRNA synthetase beta chain